MWSAAGQDRARGTRRPRGRGACPADRGVSTCSTCVGSPRVRCFRPATAAQESWRARAVPSSSRARGWPWTALSVRCSRAFCRLRYLGLRHCESSFDNQKWSLVALIRTALGPLNAQCPLSPSSLCTAAARQGPGMAPRWSIDHRGAISADCHRRLALLPDTRRGIVELLAFEAAPRYAADFEAAH